jgi:hypothetical protein
MIISRSNSAKVPSICSIARPAGVEVSKASVAETKCDAKSSEFLDEGDEVALSAGEPVDLEDEQDVDAA